MPWAMVPFANAAVIMGYLPSPTTVDWGSPFICFTTSITIRDQGISWAPRMLPRVSRKCILVFSITSVLRSS